MAAKERSSGGGGRVERRMANDLRSLAQHSGVWNQEHPLAGAVTITGALAGWNSALARIHTVFDSHAFVWLAGAPTTTREGACAPRAFPPALFEFDACSFSGCWSLEFGA